MLRLLVLALMLANAAYFAWAHGFLADWGIAPAQQAEPQRLAQQIKPEAIRLLSADEARRIENTPPPRPPECLMAGPLDDRQIAVVKQELQAWPATAWTFEAGVEPPRWIVYMGKYPNVEMMAKKKAELRGLGVPFEALQNATLEPGVSLGGYASQAEATRQLDILNKRGVHTAKVVQERGELKGQLLKLPAVDDELRPRLEDLKTALAGKALRACKS
ncbi:SPOR domain-containing protein [Caenimonas koreensis]|uniref:SPOR domain-containing protein n=1 Tax=Caenimonas koreensis TaxID=367474 RepID=UPI00378477F6